MVDKIDIEIGLTGDEEIKRKLIETAGSFKQATADISKLGNTMAEALNSAALAAKKFGASANELAGVETRIRSIGARARDTGRSFSELAANFSRAAGNASQLGESVEKAQISLALLARIGGAVGVAVASGVALITQQTIGFARAVNQASAEAIKLGIGFEQFDQLRLGLEKAGISSKAISSGLTNLQGIIDKFNIAKVKKAYEDLAQLSQVALPGNTKLAFLKEQAKGFGEAADLARQALQQLHQIDPFKPLSESMGPAEKLMRELGLSLDKFSGKAVTLNDILPRAVEALRQMPESADRSKLAIMLLKEAGVELEQVLRTGGISVDQFKQQFGLMSTEQEAAANRLVQSINKLESAWTRFGSVTLAPQITDGINTIITALETLQTAIELYPSVWKGFSSAALSALFPIYNQILSIINLFKGAKQVLAEPAGGTPLPGGAPIGGPGGGIGGGFAGGGLLGGRGTGMSDSNLAWVSRGEHIMPARAVAQPGVLAFLEALRRSGGNLSRVLDGIGRFALGGMVPRAMPAYAAGGLAGGGNNVTIQFPGLPAIGGLRASTQVVDELRKSAVLAQVRSGGRKPSRYS